MKGLLTSILTVLTITGLQAQPLPATPKLVVGLTIDQLRTDYLEAFSSLYGEKGFKRLWKEGKVFRNAEYNFSKVDRCHLYRNNAFYERNYRQSMVGYFDTTPY